MIKWLQSFIWNVENEKPTLTPNSCSPIPKNKFNQLARDIEDYTEDEEPFKNIYEYQRWKTKNGYDLSVYYDLFNHF